MARKIVTCLLCVFTIYASKAKCKIISCANIVSSINMSRWGQSFVADCSSGMQSVTFNVASNISKGSTLIISEGLIYNSNHIHTQSFNSIKGWGNIIALNSSLKPAKSEHYPLDIKTNDTKRWRIKNTKINPVQGKLKTHLIGDSTPYCGSNFIPFDNDFTISIDPIPPFISKNLETIDLFIWAGQSNAQGWQGDGLHYPIDKNNLDETIWLNYEYIGSTSSNGWVKMQPQKGRFPKGHFGPEVSFARELKKAGYHPAIFKFSQGGSSIYNNWKTPKNGGYYDDMILKLNTAIAELENLGYEVKVKGFIWIQGESDAQNSTLANAYKENLKSIINDLRSNVLNNHLLPIILSVDEQHPWMLVQPAVLNAHHTIAKNDARIKFTSMKGLPKADSTHLTPDGLVLHGKKIFSDMLSLLNF